jgi:large subunit ribosomal protein L5
MEKNNMKRIFVGKITLNVGVGKPGDELEKAIKLLGVISGMKPIKTVAKKRIPTWGLRPGLEIGGKVTLRGKAADELLKRLLKAKGNTLNKSCFDDGGSFSFGIKEYLDIQGVKYDPSIGIIGLEIAVTLVRPGYYIKLRRIKRRRIGSKHLIKKEEAMSFISQNYGITLKEEE